MESSQTNGNRKTIIIGGFGPGISTAVAEQFGSNGFSLALIGRNAERVAAGAKELTARASAQSRLWLTSVSLKRFGTWSVRCVLHWARFRRCNGQLLALVRAI